MSKRHHEKLRRAFAIFTIVPACCRQDVMVDAFPSIPSHHWNSEAECKRITISPSQVQFSSLYFAKREGNDDTSSNQSNASSPITEEERHRIEDKARARRRRQRNLDCWGVDSLAPPRINDISNSLRSRMQSPTFPSTFDAVADETFNAIAGTICGLQRPDPNKVTNAMHKSVLDYRPTHPAWASSRRWVDGDDEDGNKRRKAPQSKLQMIDTPARMGIEIDGAAYLLSSYELADNSIQSDFLRGKSTDEGRALRILSLEIARRLSVPWDGFEEAELNTSTASGRLVAVYFNSMEQTLMASNELRRLKQTYSDRRDEEGLDRIQIFCLGQHTLPNCMIQQKRKSKQSNYKSKKGIVLIVKPTDYETDSPTTTIHTNTIEKLQSILLQASASSVPAVVLSPRLTDLPPLQQPPTTHPYKRTGPSGFEQSGFQRSSIYGGVEPPAGPTSWLLRDLVPPVYVWVGCSLDMISKSNTAGQRKRAYPSLKSLSETYRNQQLLDNTGGVDEVRLEDGVGNVGVYSFYSRVVMTQSSMDTGHAYHLFAVEEKCISAESRNDVMWRSSYHYMGSTKASLGRPTSDVMRDVFAEWREISDVHRGSEQ
ncbi:predicted protein [Thalassiosira pseudonana CCMP1335]|uniref:Uncharacterized protein n=1 Tax=Thalassiosira pseudonana TaxID=35128 RepID=B8BVV9_THAPS|nr:predicted protein [Thalassiosira pseudonana CCMP1335]EED95524.1 predicted protein [Thalassiosira pseudonana CCMP1335]|eukprot:scaffold1627_cov164-Alexandrium_tamarense.AAC.15